MSNSNAAFSLSTQLLFHVAESWDTLAEQHVLFCALYTNNLTASSPKHNFNAITANFCVLWSPNLGLPCRTSEPSLLSDSESFLGSIKTSNFNAAFSFSTRLPFSCRLVLGYPCRATCPFLCTLRQQLNCIISQTQFQRHHRQLLRSLESELGPPLSDFRATFAKRLRVVSRVYQTSNFNAAFLFSTQLPFSLRHVNATLHTPMLCHAINTTHHDNATPRHATP